MNWLFGIIAIFSVAFFIGCTQSVTDFDSCISAGYPAMESYPRQCSDGTNTYTEDISGIANPASVYCEEQGYVLEMRTNENGTYGMCISGDKECEEWTFFRGECSLD